ncbi:hypothetical protein N7540_011892 [Penicillium herquei]|nr:hypothetical protein N7540_011892 [Penicillium herquei]
MTFTEHAVRALAFGAAEANCNNGFRTREYYLSLSRKSAQTQALESGKLMKAQAILAVQPQSRAKDDLRTPAKRLGDPHFGRWISSRDTPHLMGVGTGILFFGHSIHIKVLI